MRFSRSVRYRCGPMKCKISSKLLESFLRYGQKISKCINGFPPFEAPKIFFKNRALSLSYPYGALTSCKKLEKSLERFLRYLKTDEPTDGRTNGRTDQLTDGPSDRQTNGRSNEQERLLKTPLGKPGVQNTLLPRI